MVILSVTFKVAHIRYFTASQASWDQQEASYWWSPRGEMDALQEWHKNHQPLLQHLH